MGSYCPACKCDISREVANAKARQISPRFDRRKVTRVALLLERAEHHLVDPKRQSVGDLWRQDVLAIRYVFNRLMAKEAR